MCLQLLSTNHVCTISLSFMLRHCSSLQTDLRVRLTSYTQSESQGSVYQATIRPPKVVQLPRSRFGATLDPAKVAYIQGIYQQSDSRRKISVSILISKRQALVYELFVDRLLRYIATHNSLVGERISLITSWHSMLLRLDQCLWAVKFQSICDILLGEN
jgi:hypothetical protein